jgi:hypothetical protein
LIFDKGIDSRIVNDIVERETGIPLDNNSILQRRGRVGRVKPGVCTLITRFVRDWNDIKPVPIVPPLAKMSLSTVCLTSAKHGIDITDLDVLSDLDPVNIEENMEKLKLMGLIDRESSTIKLTDLGEKVLKVPLDPELAMVVVTAPLEIQPAVIALASFEGKSLYHMSMKDGRLVNGIADPRSFLITRVNIVREAFRARCRENRDTTLREFCEQNGIWIKAMKRVLRAFGNIVDTGLGEDEHMFKDLLLDSCDDTEMDKKIIEHMSKSPLFRTIDLQWNYRKNSYGGNFMGMRCFISRDEASYLNLQKFEEGPIRVLCHPSIIKKESYSFVALADVSILDEFEKSEST